jgi:hypothetical protein
MHAVRTFPRWLSLCAAALVLLQLGGTLHLAVAPHGICWEHGVVVDLDATPRGGESVADQHPHCPALWVFRQARLGSSSSTPVLASADHPAVIAGPQDVSPPAGWALHRAPKQSPPV